MRSASHARVFIGTTIGLETNSHAPSEPISLTMKRAYMYENSEEFFIESQVTDCSSRADALTKKES